MAGIISAKVIEPEPPTLFKSSRRVTGPCRLIVLPKTSLGRSSTQFGNADLLFVINGAQTCPTTSSGRRICPPNRQASCRREVPRDAIAQNGHGCSFILFVNNNIATPIQSLTSRCRDVLLFY